MHLFKMIGGGIGLSLALLSAQTLSSTVADARSDHRPAYRSHYREYNIPDAYQTGSFNWWQEMDRQGRGGRR
jgi:hypothetical protein